VIKNFILFSLLFIALIPFELKGANIASLEIIDDSMLVISSESELSNNDINITPAKKIKFIAMLQGATTENKKITAAVLTLTLGMLGVHRIYLGTAPYIPAVYLFTFGGGFFVLAIIDLVMILSTKDISKFENNNKLLMWTND